MLRNLLYSFFSHIIFIALLFLSTVDFDTKIMRMGATPLTINFLNENIIDNLKEIKTKSQNKNLEKLSIDDKIDLYNKVKNKNNLEKNDKILYEKSTKKPLKKLNDENSNVGEENKFFYHYTPIYIAENKVNTEEKRKLIENRLKKEELRKKIKEKKLVTKLDIEIIKQVQTMEQIIKISEKPLIVKKENKKIKENIDKIVNINEENNKIEENKKSNDINELIQEINIADNIIDKKYGNLDVNEIFSDADYNKLKEIEENKDNTKYDLSLREKRNIQRQIKGCYKMAILRSKKDSKAIIALTVKIGQNGAIKMNGIEVNKIVDNFDKIGFDIALENAKSALVFCSPLRGLPEGKYKTWKQMTFIFDSNNLE